MAIYFRVHAQFGSGAACLNSQPDLATKPPIRVLLVSPRPEDESTPQIDHRVGALPVIEALTGLGDLAEFKVLEPPTFQAEVRPIGV
jgi:hypothetical protein